MPVASFSIIIALPLISASNVFVLEELLDDNKPRPTQLYSPLIQAAQLTEN